MNSLKTIAVIKNNKCNFNDLGNYAAKLLYYPHPKKVSRELKSQINNYIWSVVEPYVEFINIEENSLIDVISQQISKSSPDKQLDQFYYHTEASYSFPKKYLEIVHATPLWDEYVKNKPENINHLACLFNLNHYTIENIAIIISNAYDLSAPKFVRIESITKDDIVRVVRRRFFFTAILIKNNEFIKYYYQDPSLLISKIYNITPEDTISRLSINDFRYNLSFYFQQNENKAINQPATRINGRYRLHGDVLLLHELTENVYANLSEREAKRLNVLSYGDLTSREMKEDEKQSLDSTEMVDVIGDENTVPKPTITYWSRYILMEKRIKIWKDNVNLDNCMKCDKYMESKFLCPKCYRVKICSVDCLVDNQHDCIENIDIVPSEVKLIELVPKELLPNETP